MSREFDFRLMRISSTHDEIFEHLDRTDKLTARERRSLETTMKNTMESTEQAWTKHVKSLELPETTEKRPVLYMADKKRPTGGQNARTLVSAGTEPQGKWRNQKGGVCERSWKNFQEFSGEA